MVRSRGGSTISERGRTSTCNSALNRFAFRQLYGVGTQNDVEFAAQWLAYAIPYRRFTEVLADNCARLGADVVCYSFIAADSHRLLLAGLPAHTARDPSLPKQSFTLSERTQRWRRVLESIRRSLTSNS
jgi:hypothetical protein